MDGFEKLVTPGGAGVPPATSANAALFRLFSVVHLIIDSEFCKENFI